MKQSYRNWSHFNPDLYELLIRQFRGIDFGNFENDNWKKVWKGDGES